MRFKMAHSEVDGLFMKANRKHQILLNFELKRIAVEKKMRERYFAFEKSLVIAHQRKIIEKQKALGIHRPKTTPPAERRVRNAADSFFLTKVPIDTKAGARLPPILEMKRKSKSFTKEKASGFSSRTEDAITIAKSIKNFNNPRDSLPGWSLTEGPITYEVESNDEEVKKKSLQNNDDGANGKIENMEGTVKSSEQQKEDKFDVSPILVGPVAGTPHETQDNNKTESEAKQNDSAKDNISCLVDGNKTREIIDDSVLQNDRNHKRNFKRQDSGRPQESRSTSRGSRISNHANRKSSLEDSLGKEERPKSASLGSVDGVRTDLMNLSLRAQSAGLK